MTTGRVSVCQSASCYLHVQKYVCLSRVGKNEHFLKRVIWGPPWVEKMNTFYWGSVGAPREWRRWEHPKMYPLELAPQSRPLGLAGPSDDDDDHNKKYLRADVEPRAIVSNPQFPSSKLCVRLSGPLSFFVRCWLWLGPDYDYANERVWNNERFR